MQTETNPIQSAPAQPTTDEQLEAALNEFTDSGVEHIRAVVNNLVRYRPKA